MCQEESWNCPKQNATFQDSISNMDSQHSLIIPTHLLKFLIKTTDLCTFKNKINSKHTHPWATNNLSALPMTVEM